MEPTSDVILANLIASQSTKVYRVTWAAGYPSSPWWESQFIVY